MPYHIQKKPHICQKMNAVSLTEHTVRGVIG